MSRDVWTREGVEATEKFELERWSKMVCPFVDRKCATINCPAYVRPSHSFAEHDGIREVDLYYYVDGYCSLISAAVNHSRLVYISKG